jgi:hypothetical protein
MRDQRVLRVRIFLTNLTEVIAEIVHRLRSRADAVATGPDKRIDDRRRKPREKELAE